MLDGSVVCSFIVDDAERLIEVNRGDKKEVFRVSVDRLLSEHGPLHDAVAVLVVQQQKGAGVLIFKSVVLSTACKLVCVGKRLKQRFEPHRKRQNWSRRLWLASSIQESCASHRCSHSHWTSSEPLLFQLKQPPSQSACGKKTTQRWLTHEEKCCHSTAA